MNKLPFPYRLDTDAQTNFREEITGNGNDETEPVAKVQVKIV